ncbi:MAG: hypothetical protein ABI880_09910, partial [Acidobacteriota bacterium]
LVVSGAPSFAFAQAGAGAGPALRPWHPVLSIGAAWTGAQDLGRVTAEMRRAAVGVTAPSPFTLFTTESTLGSAVAGEFAVAVPVTAHWAVAVRGSAARPTLTTVISADAEAAPNTEASEQISDYAVDGSLIYQLPRLGGRRARAYVLAGGGYVRQLHEDNVLVETGSAWHGGAGLRWWLRGADGRARAMGLTGEARWVWRSGGITFTDGTRSAPNAAVGVFVSF